MAASPTEGRQGSAARSEVASASPSSLRANNSNVDLCSSGFDTGVQTCMKSIARSEGRDVAVEMILGLRPATEKHSVPVIDRMMEVLTELERRVEGASITDLTATLGQPRSSIYRILNTLERHDMVRRNPDGTYVL